MTHQDDKVFNSLNCEVCGTEELDNDLITKVLFSRAVLMCKECSSKSPQDSMNDILIKLNDIKKAAEKKNTTPERRLKLIKKIVNGIL